jgi:uncharacterized protein YbjQ (UPF0145 family)
MLIKDIAKQHKVDQSAFETWLRVSGYNIKSGFSGTSIDDSLNADDLVKQFKDKMDAQRLLDEQARIEAQRSAAEAAEIAAKAASVKKEALAGMLITSGFNFDGYTITKYSGYISGDGAVSMDRPRQGWLGGVNRDVGQDILEALSQIRRKALEELKEAALALGCNAVIGVDFDYLSMDPETVNSGGGTLYLPFLFAVTANGNAVVIERN